MTSNSFRTNLKIPKVNVNIEHHQNILLLGSCFTQNIGDKLASAKMEVLQNPFGILFNPIAIANCIDCLIYNKEFTETDLLYFDDSVDKIWLSLKHHSLFSDTNKDVCLNKINTAINAGHQFIQKTNILILTLGTSIVYSHYKTDQIVANCHKIPAKEFERKFLDTNEVKTALQTSIEKLKTINPNLKVIVTVSPVRHLKEGFLDNQKSKSILYLALNELCEQNKNCCYFPSYELMMDDLRDYRFYNADLLHPNDVAIDYIWRYFLAICMETNTQILIEKLEKLQRSLKHRPRFPQSKKHQNFLHNLMGDIAELQAQHPHLNFSKEQELLQKQLLPNINNR